MSRSILYCEPCSFSSVARVFETGRDVFAGPLKRAKNLLKSPGPPTSPPPQKKKDFAVCCASLIPLYRLWHCCTWRTKCRNVDANNSSTFRSFLDSCVFLFTDWEVIDLSGHNSWFEDHRKANLKPKRVSQLMPLIRKEFQLVLSKLNKALNKHSSSFLNFIISRGLASASAHTHAACARQVKRFKSTHCDADESRIGAASCCLLQTEGAVFLLLNRLQASWLIGLLGRERNQTSEVRVSEMSTWKRFEKFQVYAFPASECSRGRVSRLVY